MARRRIKIREEAFLFFHEEEHEVGSREWKIIHALAEEEDFNDSYATAVVTDDTRMVSYSLGK